MCRIAGIINQQFSTAALQERVKQMCLSQAHGGPDDEGVYAERDIALGHRRLAIIDLSPRGHQPMADASKGVYITFNGEIYNYQQLKAELTTLGTRFETATDTEVIIQAYLHWGKAAFTKLHGMFAFALYDAGKKLTWLVRDRSGIKPLYYYANQQLLVFSSEVRAIKASGLSLETDEQWAIRFLAFGHIPEPYTTLKQVFSLQKGHYLCWDHTQCTFTIDSFITDNETQPVINHPHTAQQHIGKVFDTAIRQQLIADAPIGVFLSGGVDSSIITLLADQHTNLLKTVSIYFDEQAYNERHYQQTVLARVNAEAYQHLVTQQDFEAALPQIIADMDLPTTDGINSWFISKYARQSGLKAVLSGIGADELFGGYPSFKRIKYLKYLKLIPGATLKAIARMSKGPLRRLELLTYRHPIAEYLFLRGLFTPAEIARILGISKKQVEDCLFADAINPGLADNKSKAAWFETNLYMQNQLLRDTDVMSMAHGLEVRVPFLDEELQQLVAHIDPAIRFDEAQQKKLLINTYQDLLPEAVWNRRKMGFSFPLQKWMQQHKQIGQPEFYQNKAAQRLIHNFGRNKMHWSKAFALYHLQINQPSNYRLPERKKLLFLTLNTFRTTGGVQKMGRTMGYALQSVTDALSWNYKFWAGYDHQTDLDTAYARPENFKGFSKLRSFFAADAIQEGIRSDLVILSHINLAMVGCMIKKLSPETQVWLIAHGIEIWRPMQSFKKQILHRCDKILCVSNYTRDKIIDLHQIPADKCTVLNNALDPQLRFPQTFNRPQYLVERYGLNTDDKIIFSLARLASTEQYKGYEHVITAVAILKQEFPNIKYVLSGQYDAHEEQRIRQLIKDHQVQQQVIITGFVPENELEDHFLLADLFVLPSKKEGFGIVFIEAMACGLPVICGNADGSLDAIKNGELGTAIDVDNVAAITTAIKNHFNQPFSVTDRQLLQERCIAYFNIDVYKQQLKKLLLAAPLAV